MNSTVPRPSLTKLQHSSIERRRIASRIYSYRHWLTEHTGHALKIGICRERGSHVRQLISLVIPEWEEEIASSSKLSLVTGGLGVSIVLTTPT